MDEKEAEARPVMGTIFLVIIFFSNSWGGGGGGGGGGCTLGEGGGGIPVSPPLYETLQRPCITWARKTLPPCTDCSNIKFS